MGNSYFFTDEFKDSIRLAGAQARIETLQAGVPVFYKDTGRNIEIMEHPGGQKFEIRYIDGAPGDRNYEVLRELATTIA